VRSTQEPTVVRSTQQPTVQRERRRSSPHTAQMDLRGKPEQMDLGNLPTVWKAVEIMHREAEQLAEQPRSKLLTARLIDEGQVAGPRTYITVSRLLQVALDNHLALVGLIQSHGVTHWAPWNLMRPVFEAAFYVIWILDPNDSRDRRRRGLRAEINDANEKKRWVESLIEAGISRKDVEPLRRRRDEVTQIYRSEASALGVTWETVQQKINLIAEIPKLETLLDAHGQKGRALFVTTWRRLSGFQHGLSYALQAGATANTSVKIPGGESVFFTINDEDFIATAQLTSAIHVSALQLYKKRCTQAS
jgi:hypothetical protein